MGAHSTLKFLEKASFKTPERKHNDKYFYFLKTWAAKLLTAAMEQQREIIKADIKLVDKKIHAKYFGAFGCGQVDG